MALTTGLQAYYKLEDVNDSSGNGYTLTNNGTATFAAGKIYNAVDGGASNSGKYLSVSSNLGIDGGTMSYSAWVNVTTQLTGANETQSILSLGSDNTDVTYHLYYMTEASVKKIGFNRLRNGIADGYTYYPTTLTAGTWYHIVTTYDGTNSRIYVNGVLQATAAQSGNGSGTTTSRFFIMNSTQTTTLYFSGLVDEVGIWNRAVTSAEVVQLYGAGFGYAYPLSSSFVARTTRPALFKPGNSK